MTGKTDEGRTGEHNLRSAAFAARFPIRYRRHARRCRQFGFDATIGIGEA
jgi:hypothetical protein